MDSSKNTKAALKCSYELYSSAGTIFSQDKSLACQNPLSRNRDWSSRERVWLSIWRRNKNNKKPVKHGNPLSLWNASVNVKLRVPGDPLSHTPSIAFRHLPPNSARYSYANEGALFVSAQLSSDAVSALRKVRVLV